MESCVMMAVRKHQALRSVSDTALLVACDRALKTRRPGVVLLGRRQPNAV